MNILKETDPHSNVPLIMTPSKTETDKEFAALMDKYKTKQDKTHIVIPFGPVFNDINEKGIRVFKDERLKESCKELPKYSNLISPSSITLTPDQFKRFISTTRPFLMTIFKDELIIPHFSLFETEMSFLFEACRFDESGKVYEEVPHLKKLDPELWQMGFCSVDGQVYLSDPEKLKPFPLMSISKMFLYILAIDLLGFDVVHAYVGLQTTRKSLFEKECVPGTTRSFKKPLNAATECGAIVLASLLFNVALKDLCFSAKYEYIDSYIKEMAGIGHTGSDKSIFMSMMDNHSKYISLCYYLESCNAFRWPHDIIKDLEFYLQVNLPVAFGESGCCLLLLPGVMAYSFISPNLSEEGFSVKAYRYIQGFCDLYDLHPFETIKKESEEKKSVCPKSCSMFKVVGDGDYFLMFSLIQKGMRPCAKNPMDETILHFAAATGSMKCVEFVLRLCPYLLSRKDLMGNTPCKVAEFFGHQDIAAFLESKQEEKRLSQTIFRGTPSKS
nr:glutaminase kidney isoform, mitochondrial isoform X4 [Halyomorpha halys]